MICRKCLLLSTSRAGLLRSAGMVPARGSGWFNTWSSTRNGAGPTATSTSSTTSVRSASTTPTATSSPPATASSPSPTPTKTSRKKSSALIKSSVPAGTPLKGLNFEKNKQDPVALADDEYPEWLWGILDRRKGSQDGEGEGGVDGDMFSKSKKQRRLAAKRLRKAQLLNPGLFSAPRIPLYEQTIDLPAATATTTSGGAGSASDASQSSSDSGATLLESTARARSARDEVTRAMRGKRRKDIKEGNFLKGMR